MAASRAQEMNFLPPPLPPEMPSNAGTANHSGPGHASGENHETKVSLVPVLLPPWKIRRYIFKAQPEKVISGSKSSCAEGKLVLLVEIGKNRYLFLQPWVNFS